VRVGLVVPGFSADASDWCIPALRHLARGLAYRDDVRVVALRYPYRSSRYAIDGAEVIALGGGVRHAIATFDLWRAALGALRAEHQRRPFDVLHAFWATESGLLAALAGRLLGVPVLVSLAGGELVALRDIDYGDQRIAWERLKIATSLRLATCITAGSRLLQQLALHHMRGRRRVEIAPLGVDTTLFAPDTASTDDHMELRLVHVGTLTPVKDHATLLRAFALVHRQQPALRLELVGEGPLAPELRRLASSLSVESAVCFRGEIDHARVPSIYRGATACVISSRHEAQCMAALEAAACGVPLVGTRVGMLPELTRALVPVGDQHSLAEAIAAGLDSRLASDSVSEVRAAFGLEPCLERFRGLYHSSARGQ
jgi:glycosyltransferase involved in cell wall biosynthesis